MKTRNKISLITVFTVISLTQCFSDTNSVIAKGGGSGQDAGKIIKANIAKSEQNIAKCKAHLTEIDKINQDTKNIVENFSKYKDKSRLDYIRKDIAQIESELKNEKNPAQRAELQKMIKAIRAVDADLRRRGI